MKKLLALSTILLALAVNSQIALADVNLEPNVPDAVKGPETSELVTNVVTTLSFIAGVACVIAIIVGGIMYITSAGDEKRVQTAKNTLLYAVIGIVIALSAYAIATFVVNQIQ